MQLKNVKIQIYHYQNPLNKSNQDKFELGDWVKLLSIYLTNFIQNYFQVKDKIVETIFVTSKLKQISKNKQCRQWSHMFLFKILVFNSVVVRNSTLIIKEN